MRHISIAVLLLAACDPSYLDHGLLTTDEGVELYPVVQPLGVEVDPSTSRELVEDAATWWSEQLSRDGVPRRPFEVVDAGGQVLVETGYIPVDWDASNTWTDAGGRHVLLCPLEQDGRGAAVELCLGPPGSWHGRSPVWRRLE